MLRIGDCARALAASAQTTHAKQPRRHAWINRFGKRHAGMTNPAVGQCLKHSERNSGGEDRNWLLMVAAIGIAASD
jgi:hypothetical protein